eukprot:TRINITY_DN4058_c0_g1_i2.p2 TRINITY_DN4058_c0_g1~~TRINITY_DN4058_c0_g1_i2.p2  ORF type:complete len:119 (+),score=39.73 TRINITY_DN4058_c0_g1_i2:193-549(+)
MFAAFVRKEQPAELRELQGESSADGDEADNQVLSERQISVEWSKLSEAVRQEFDQKARELAASAGEQEKEEKTLLKLAGKGKLLPPPVELTLEPRGTKFNLALKAASNRMDREERQRM